MKGDVMQITNNDKFRIIIKAILFNFLLTFLGIVIYSFILAYTNISDSTISGIVTGISVFSIFFTTIVYCKRIGISGLINGIMISGLYMMLVYLVSSMFKVGFNFNKESILMIIIAILFGGIGGIIGVNMNKYQR